MKNDTTSREGKKEIIKLKEKIEQIKDPNFEDIKKRKAILHICNCVENLEVLFTRLDQFNEGPNEDNNSKRKANIVIEHKNHIINSYNILLADIPKNQLRQNAIAITTMALGVVLIVAGAALIAGGILGVGFSFGGSLAAIPLGGKIAMAGTSITAGGVATTLAAYKIHKNRKKENLSSAKALEVIRTAKEIEKISKALADNKKPKEVKGKKV